MSNRDSKIDYSPLAPDRFNMPGATSISPVDTAKYWEDNWKQLQKTYGLNDEDYQLLLPMLISGASPQELFSYIQNLSASHKETKYNEGSIARDIASLRSAGYNPDLSGSLPSGSGSMSLPKSSPFSVADLPSNGGSSSLAEKFTSVAGLVLKTMSFGLQAYGVVSNSLLSTAGVLSGMADKDVLSLFGNEEGIVEDVDSAIASLISANGLHGRKAKQYASYVANRINSTLAVTGRLRGASDKALALYDSKINSFKASDEYTNQITAFLRDTANTQALMAEYDLKIQEQKLDWLEKHPDYTAEQLDIELANLRSGKVKASAEASKAVSEAGVASEHLEQQKIVTQTAKDEYPVKKLASNIRQTELEGISAMIDFCKSYQSAHSTVPKWAQSMDMSNEGFKYRNNMRYIKDWYNKNKHSDDPSLSSFLKVIGSFLK